MKTYTWIIDGGKTPSQTLTRDAADCLMASVASIHREVDMGYAIARITPNGRISFFRFGEEIQAEDLFNEKAWKDYESSSSMIFSLLEI